MININQIFAGYKKPQNIHEISNIKTIETYNMFEKIITKKKKNQIRSNWKNKNRMDIFKEI